MDDDIGLSLSATKMQLSSGDPSAIMEHPPPVMMSLLRVKRIKYKIFAKILHHLSGNILVGAKIWSQNIFLAIDGPDGFEIEHWIKWIARVSVLLKHSVAELGPLVDKNVSGGTKVVHHAGVDIQQEVLSDLDV